MGNYLLISDAAKEVRVESHVLRYWEEELHLPIKRNELGHRYYTEDDVERFKQIKGMKERGLQLKAIKMILKDGKLDLLLPGEHKPEKSEPGQSGPEQSGSEQLKPEQSRLEKSRPEQSKPEESVQESDEEPAQAEGKVEMAIDIVGSRENAVTAETREDKSRRLQWLLQQLIRETLQENNGELCREIKESVVKELDYQFRMQEEREEARDKKQAARDEEYYKKMDELLRKKSKKRFRLGKKGKGTS